MPRKKDEDFEEFDIDFEPSDFEEDFTETELEDLYDLLEDFPELDDMDGILDFGDADFYTEEGS